MDKSRCIREFFKYSVFSVLGTLGVSCYILADTFFISRGLGVDGLAALNLAIPVYNFIYGPGLMLGMGGATKFSICKSQGETRRMDEIFTITFWFSVILSVLFVAVGVFAPKQLALLLKADTNCEVLSMTTTYLRWLLTFAPAFIINQILLCFIRNDDNPKLVMGAMLVGSFSNIILDYVFIFPMNMGMFGAILATGLSPVISILVMAPHWLGSKKEFHIVRTKWNSDIIKQDISIGFSSFVAQVSAGIVMIIFNILILGLEGNVGVAAYGVIANIALVIVGIYTGLAQGIQPLISTAYGRGDEVYIKRIYKYAIATMTAFSVIVYILLVFFATPVVNVFNSEENAMLQEIAELGIFIYFTSNLFVGYNTIGATYFASIERPVQAQLISLLRGFVIIIPMAFIMSEFWGMTGVWLVYPVTELIVAIICLAIKRGYDKISLVGDNN